MAEEEYIWIRGWREYQHYRPERDRAPAWIKTYTRILSEDWYRGLSCRRRTLCHDLAVALSCAFGELRHDPVALSRRLGSQVFRADLDALVDAGFLELVSRETLDARLAEFYNGSRGSLESGAPARSRRERVRERTLPPNPPPAAGVEAKSEQEQEEEQREEENGDPLHELDVLARQVGWLALRRQAAAKDPARAVAWLRFATRAVGVGSPAAYAWKCFESGEWPPVAEQVDVVSACRKWMASPACDPRIDTDETVVDEFVRLANRCRVALGRADLDVLMAEWRVLFVQARSGSLTAEELEAYLATVEDEEQRVELARVAADCLAAGHHSAGDEVQTG